ncbi:hypothetical protein F3Y22_tig00111342pilonHSYRG00180 [Hibiscus syriacus]|uniref:FYVE-type domain-containing protein n=1 Tax=Hibiscus syriacus TaxID=106335 RepID=A0A6A2YP65_HIBSY|nr:hypothetical protein F3Y22_tig00111342pilonHSYRG00180 [Hibiscus syriacus]
MEEKIEYPEILQEEYQSKLFSNPVFFSILFVKYLFGCQENHGNGAGKNTSSYNLRLLSLAKAARALDDDLPDDGVHFYTDACVILEDDGNEQMAFDLYRATASVYVKLEKLISYEDECREESNPVDKNVVQDGKQLISSEGEVDPGVSWRNDVEIVSGLGNQKQGKVFYYDNPISEETGVWTLVSVPPMTENKHEEWDRGLFLNGGHFPDDGLGSNQFTGDSKDLTMWDVFSELLIAARGKVSAIASGDVQRCGIAWLSNHLLEQTWNEMAQTLAEANFGNFNEILEAEPPKWLADSAASTCMLCNVRFHPIMRSRHHCRFCGGIFCNECSRGRSLLPMKFCMGNPQRVCDVCCVRLEPVQPYLMDWVSRAAQLPTHDLTDLSTLRSWLNFPWGQSMEYEIYKAANTITNYRKVGSLKPEKSIPDAILKQAKGLAILTVAKVGVMVTYNIGTGLVVARRDDGSGSPPSAITSLGAGGEFTDFVIVLGNESAVATFSGNMHLSVGAGSSAAVGIVGRAAEADIRGGSGGYAACYTYSCSKASRSYFHFIFSAQKKIGAHQGPV